MNSSIDKEALRARELQHLDEAEGFIQAYLEHPHSPKDVRHAGHLLREIEQLRRRLTGKQASRVILVEQQ